MLSMPIADKQKNQTLPNWTVKRGIITKCLVNLRYLSFFLNAGQYVLPLIAKNQSAKVSKVDPMIPRHSSTIQVPKSLPISSSTRPRSIRTTYPSVVFTSTCASMSVCHLRHGKKKRGGEGDSSRLKNHYLGESIKGIWFIFGGIP